ncbi:YdeI family protein, partial [Chloroflexota bacterium]
MELDKAIYFADSREWHKWLENNHDSAREAWLFHYKKKSGRSGVSYKEALEEAICFGWIDGKLRSIDEEKYILRYSPRKARSVWSKINRDKAEELIKAGRMQEAGLLKIEEAKKNGNWDNAYTSRQPEEMPADLEKALEEDTTAR